MTQPLVPAVYTRVAQAAHSLALATGCFSADVGHEPKSAPDDPAGLFLALWGSEVRPIQASGMGVISVRLEIQLRIHRGMLTDPQDAIDMEVYNATHAVLAALIGDSTLVTTDATLAGQVRMLDILGSDGDSLRAVPGYITLGSTMFRVQDIFIPYVVNDVFQVG